MPNPPDTYTEKDGLTTGSNGEALGDNRYFFTDLNICLQSGKPTGYAIIPIGTGEYTGREQEGRVGILDDEEVPEVDEREIGKMMSDIGTIKGDTTTIKMDVSNLREGMAGLKENVKHIEKDIKPIPGLAINVGKINTKFNMMLTINGALLVAVIAGLFPLYFALIKILPIVTPQ